MLIKGEPLNDVIWQPTEELLIRMVQTLRYVRNIYERRIYFHIKIDEDVNREGEESLTDRQSMMV